MSLFEAFSMIDKFSFDCVAFSVHNDVFANEISDRIRKRGNCAGEISTTVTNSLKT